MTELFDIRYIKTASAKVLKFFFKDPTLMMKNREKSLKSRMATLAASGQATEDRKYARSSIDDFIKK